MRRRSYMLLAVVATLVALLALPTAASAAQRKVPFGFFGAVVSPELGQIPAATLDEQMALMASSGVESVRVTFDWRDLEPAQGAYDFARADLLVATAARHGLSLILNVTASPHWISKRPNSPEASRFPPRSPAPYAELMRQLVRRYGPNGTLWAQDPSLPRLPVAQWQIWNEQTAPWHWDARRWAPGYTKLLREAYRAIKQEDRGAQVIAGSLVAPRADYAPWDSIRDLYRAGAKRYFDVVSIHPFTNDRRSVRGTVRQTLEIVRRVRAQMRRRRDGRTPIILTEMTWPASAGKVPRRARFGLETTRRGQAQRLTAAYRALAKARRKLRITQVHWYTWATQYTASGPLSVMTFRFAGLTRISGDVFSPMPILSTYARLAASYAGCRKSADARRCR